MSGDGFRDPRDPRCNSSSGSRYNDKYLTPSYPSSTIANISGTRSHSSSAYTSNNSSRSSLSSSSHNPKPKPKPKPVTVSKDPSYPKNSDRYDQKTDSRYYENSFRTSTKPKHKDSSARKEYDTRYYAGSSYYQD
ncbi:hypothetical protein N7G274_008962 [Stereocaulon virgatum]|uniref:Uncharacterized protein n=1 Tax=Stereocaulon virgatum TaxID=373712 RepID=A0ABR3ZZV1_9LECA